MSFKRIVCAALLFWVLCPSLLPAAVKLPSLFAEHMVLQRDQPVKVWGWAAPNESITGSMSDKKFSATTDQDGRWAAQFDAMPAGGPYTLTVNGADNKIEIEDVYVGEVWLCSGQSNMAMNVARALNPEQAAADAKYPTIRMFLVTSQHARTPQDECKGEWRVCSPDSVSRFSATAYFFGRALQQELNVPIGLINSSVGGTPIESWTSLPAQAAVPEIKPYLDDWKETDASFDLAAEQAKYDRALANWNQKRKSAREQGGPMPRKPTEPVQPRDTKNYPANLFNGKINPLVGYTIRGAIWYQGENNGGKPFAQLYGKQLETMIADWRARWGQGDFPFAWVQLPNIRQPQSEPSETAGWVMIRDGMLKTLAVPNTGMAITIDIGEQNDVHPKNKQDVGKRLAAWALAAVYGKDNEASGPIFRRAERDGSRMLIQFDHAASGLVARGDKLDGFAIAGADEKFHWAQAKIEGSHIAVWSDEVSEPVAVRYAWAENPRATLFNAAGLPASPFRTDDWELEQPQQRRRR